MAAEGAGAGARVVVALSRSCRWRGGTTAALRRHWRSGRSLVALVRLALLSPLDHGGGVWDPP